MDTDPIPNQETLKETTTNIVNWLASNLDTFADEFEEFNPKDSGTPYLIRSFKKLIYLDPTAKLRINWSHKSPTETQSLISSGIDPGTTLRIENPQTTIYINVSGGQRIANNEGDLHDSLHASQVGQIHSDITEKNIDQNTIISVNVIDSSGDSIGKCRLSYHPISCACLKLNQIMVLDGKTKLSRSTKIDLSEDTSKYSIRKLAPLVANLRQLRPPRKY